jgi:uncharacterized membrane protein
MEQQENKPTPVIQDSVNLEPNVSAAFAYLVPPISGIVFFLIEKKNKFVRFHAMQSILFGIASYAVLTAIGALRVIYIGYFLQPIVTMASFAIWLLLIWKAYQNEEYHLPYLGKIAKDGLDRAQQSKQ